MNAFDIIPVIDLRQGEVVHARLGQRANYRPLQSVLNDGSAPGAVVEGLLRLYPFTTVYAADLDAIEGTGDNDHVLRSLRQAHPGLELWVDAGLRGRGQCLDWLGRDIGDAVLGSETLREPAELDGLLASAEARRIILSLDFAGERFLGAPELLHPAHWPARVIVMTLARVGSFRGPDLERLKGFVAAAPAHRLFAAGGVRDSADLGELARAGAAGALIASALHEGRLGRQDLAALQTAPAGR